LISRSASKQNNGTLKPVKTILGRGRQMRENNREDEPNQCTLNAYMEILQ
jgi:hypothetical protein